MGKRSFLPADILTCGVRMTTENRGALDVPGKQRMKALDDTYKAVMRAKKVLQWLHTTLLEPNWFSVCTCTHDQRLPCGSITLQWLATQAHGERKAEQAAIQEKNPNKNVKVRFT